MRRIRLGVRTLTTSEEDEDEDEVDDEEEEEEVLCSNFAATLHILLSSQLRRPTFLS